MIVLDTDTTSEENVLRLSKFQPSQTKHTLIIRLNNILFEMNYKLVR